MLLSLVGPSDTNLVERRVQKLLPFVMAFYNLALLGRPGLALSGAKTHFSDVMKNYTRSFVQLCYFFSPLSHCQI